MKITTIRFLLLASFIFPVSSITGKDLIDDILKKGRTTYDSMQSYTAVIDREELIGKKIRKQKGLIYRFQKPGRIYIRITEGPDKGLEAIYDSSRYGVNMLVRKKIAGIFVKLKMKPQTPVNLGQERHTLYESDIGFMLQLIENHLLLIRSTGLGSIVQEGGTIIKGRKTFRFTAEFPQDKRFYGGRIIMNMDEKTGLPLRAEVRGWKNDLWEIYEYSNLIINPPLHNRDFEFTEL